MKATSINPKEVTKAAYAIVLNPFNLLLTKSPRLDMRYSFNKALKAEISKVSTSINRSEVLALQKKRRSNRIEFSNVLSNPLVKDFILHRKDVKQITPSLICFYGRNHHAKNEFDKKVLSILSKAL